MSSDGNSLTTIMQQLDQMAPATAKAQLGQCLVALVNQHNALLAHLDAANVTGIGNANVANFTVGLPGTYPNPF